MMPQAMLHTQNLAIGYRNKNRKAVLHDGLEISLNRGELICLLGPNGSGKSTLIRTLGGFQEPLAGEVRIDDRNISRIDVRELARLVSVVLTEQVDAGIMSVYAMVGLGRSPYTGLLGKMRKKDHHAVAEALQNTGIMALQHRRFDELSDGERQKVMLAKSLAQETPVILLDEPTAYLDFPSKVEILQLLRKAAWQQQKALLLSTHDINLALQFADRILLMGKDRPTVSGVPEDLVLNDAFGNFFNRALTRFDTATGTFKFETAHKGVVVLEGSGLKYNWLRHALERKGYEVNRKNAVGHVIASFRILPDDKIVDDDNRSSGSATFSNIHDVLQYLEQNT